MADSELLLEPGDVFLTRGASRYAALIRRLCRHPGETRTIVNHAGGILTAGTLRTAAAIESSWRVMVRPLYREYAGKRDSVAIARPLAITEAQRQALITHWHARRGRPYGLFELSMHVLDHLASRRAGREVWRFRKACRTKHTVICSTLVATGFDDALGWRMCDVPPQACQPDDIWDDWMQRPKRWRIVRALAPI